MDSKTAMIIIVASTVVTQLALLVSYKKSLSK